MLIEPTPADANWPRYSLRSFPPYRFVKGRTPHPRRHPTGHSFRQPEPRPSPIPPEQWYQSEWYLYGIDLYNFAYWWESHEIFEAFWHAVGRHTEQGQFFQGLIHGAAANLKRFLGVNHAAETLKQAMLDRFSNMPHCYMGVNIDVLVEDVRAYFVGIRDRPALIRLGSPICGKEGA